MFRGCLNFSIYHFDGVYSWPLASANGVRQKQDQALAEDDNLKGC